MYWVAGLLQNAEEGAKCFRKAIGKGSVQSELCSASQTDTVILLQIEIRILI
jgi:hypothetical protein